jgi:hypothetical protein
MSKYNSKIVDTICSYIRSGDSQKLACKKAGIGDSTFHEWIHKKKGFKDKIQKAKDELNAEKRKMYATYIMACIHPNSIGCSNKSIYMNLLDQLDYLSVYILRQLDYYTTEKRLVEKMGQNYDKEVIQVHLWGLQPCGLVDKISAKEYESLNKRGGNRRLLHPEGVFLYKRTGLGDSFLNFIVKGMPEDNSNSNEML